MPSSQACLNARSLLEKIRPLKQEFELAFDRAVLSGKEDDVEKAKSLKQQLEAEMKALQETLAIVEAERLFDLKKQYEDQLDLLKSSGLVETRKETDPSGVEKESYFITGIDEKEYPMPSYLTVLERLVEQKELFETKADQGFKKLVLVPFGMSLDLMIEKFKQFLLKYKQAKPAFDIDVDKPLYTWSHYLGADQNSTLVYDPQQFNPTDNGGKTKAEILTQMETTDDAAAGYRILLLQGNYNSQGFRSIPKRERGLVEGTNIPRADIEAGNTAIEYLASQASNRLNPQSPYAGEYGMSPEEWIILFMQHLKETGEPLDNFLNEVDSATYLTGAYFTASDGVPDAYWSRGGRRANLSGSHPGDQDGNVGVRAAVRV